MTEQWAIEAVGISHAFGKRRALDEFDLQVPLGGAFGLLGPNGSGKSTFVSLAAAAQQPQSGSLSVLGQPPHARLRRRIGTVFQESSLDPSMTPADLLGFFARLWGAARGEPVTTALALAGLSGRADDRIGTLSGGMRRRLEVARALLHQPELLLLDEPTSGVDSAEREALWQALLAGGAARTIVLATNDLAEAESVCDRVAFISQGRVVATGTPAELKRGLRRETVHLDWPGMPAEALGAIAAWHDAASPAWDGGELRIPADDGATLVPRLFALGHGIRAVRVERATLQDAYFQHVGRGRAEAAEVAP